MPGTGDDEKLCFGNRAEETCGVFYGDGIGVAGDDEDGALDASEVLRGEAPSGAGPHDFAFFGVNGPMGGAVGEVRL